MDKSELAPLVDFLRAHEHPASPWRIVLGVYKHAFKTGLVAQQASAHEQLTLASDAQALEPVTRAFANLGKLWQQDVFALHLTALNGALLFSLQWDTATVFNPANNRHVTDKIDVAEDHLAQTVSFLSNTCFTPTGYWRVYPKQGEKKVHRLLAKDKDHAIQAAGHLFAWSNPNIVFDALPPLSAL